MNINIDKSEIDYLQRELNCLIYVNDPTYDPGKLEIVKFIGRTKEFFGNPVRKSWPIPKNKEVNRAYVIGKFESFEYNYEYKNLRPVFEQLKIKGAIYYTSFGFSYDCFFKNRPTMDKEIKVLQNKLDELGIKYSNEYSDARWVYRFRFSQSKENIERIKKVTDGKRN